MVVDYIFKLLVFTPRVNIPDGLEPRGVLCAGNTSARPFDCGLSRPGRFNYSTKPVNSLLFSFGGALGDDFSVSRLG